MSSNAMADLLAQGSDKLDLMDDLDFQLPDRIVKLDEYPGLILAVQKHTIELLKMRDELERVRDGRFNVLMNTKYTKSLGDNKELRDAAFSIIVEGDKQYREAVRQYNALFYKHKEHEALVQKVTHDFSVMQLRYRGALVLSEVFGGFPVPDTGRVL